MANTNTLTTVLNGARNKVRYITINSDGTQETVLNIYDSSALNTVDPLTCTIERITYSTSMRGAAGTTGNIKILFDATTPVLACGIPINNAGKICFKKIGGLKNTGGSGRTGDLVLTTLGLIAGDSITLVIELIAN